MSTLEEQRNDVVLENGKLVVKKFETYDKEIVNYFEELEAEVRNERFETALKAGVTALKTIRITEKIDYIEKKFNSLNEEFSDTLDSTVQALDNKYEEVFGDKGKFAEIIKQHFGEDGKIIKELFNPNKDGTPLNYLRNDIKKEISDLRQQLGIKEKEKELVKKTPLKGGDFQELCEEMLSGIARMAGDLLENTTKVPGKLQDSKKGDFVVTIAENRKKIVFEVKDARISGPDIQRSLGESIENREASYGILVIKYVESLPKSVGWFQEFGNDMLVCTLATQQNEESLHEELLLIAYKWAKTRIMLQRLKEKHIDADFIQNKITKIQANLSELKKIKTRCTNIQDASEEIRTITKRFEDNVSAELSEILGSLISK